jgi:hypothetical protein
MVEEAYESIDYPQVWVKSDHKGHWDTSLVGSHHEVALRQMMQSNIISKRDYLEQIEGFPP